MVLLWKPFENNIKGILIFTHKEINNTSFINFNELTKKYFIGLHIGCWFKSKIPNYVDFIMCSPKQLENINSITHKIIPYNSRNFLPTYFDKYKNKSINSLLHSITKFKQYSKCPLPTNLLENINNIEYNKDSKYWDIITIAKPHSVKKLDCFLYSMEQLLKINPNINILIISPIAPNEYKHSKDHHNIEQIIKTKFTLIEQQHFTLFRPECNTNEGIDNEFIYPFYQWSKIFCFYTEFEGESRVAHEALCCGLPIVCYKYLKGGANEYLNENNSNQFTTYNNAYNSIIECLDTYQNMNLDYNNLQNILHEDKTINLIKSDFKTLYNKYNLEFNGELLSYNQLHFRLPGHYYYDPWAHLSDNETSDILNNNQWNLFKQIYNI